MAQQPASVDATFYAQVSPRWARYWKDAADNPILEGAKVIAMTQQRPTRPKPGTVMVKLTLRIPVGAFLPLAPEAVVVIPADMTVVSPIEVTAGDPRDGQVD